jgi:hypothetical protein
MAETKPTPHQHAQYQLAVFQHRVDQIEYGTKISWDDMGEMGQEEYMKDADRIVTAMERLGWTPPPERI